MPCRRYCPQQTWRQHQREDHYGEADQGDCADRKGIRHEVSQLAWLASPWTAVVRECYGLGGPRGISLAASIAGCRML
jgi:hypothetical protein